MSPSSRAIDAPGPLLPHLSLTHACLAARRTRGVSRAHVRGEKAAQMRSHALHVQYAPQRNWMHSTRTAAFARRFRPKVAGRGKEGDQWASGYLVRL